MAFLRTCGAVFAYTLFAISWLSWLLMLAGTAATQSMCGGYLGRTVNLKIGGTDLQTLVEGCNTTNTTAFIWWAVWFEFIVLILLSVAECCRVKGLYITKQIFLAMVSVCLMLAADRANVVISTYDGSLRNSARAAMAGQVITILCNLCLLLYFGGEITDLHRAAPADNDKAAREPVMGNQYVAEFDRMLASGPPAPVFVPAETKGQQRSSKAAATALGSESWQA